MSGEQVSFCLTISIINHLDVFKKRPFYSVSEIHNKCIFEWSPLAHNATKIAKVNRFY